MVFIFYSEGGIRKAALRNMPVACFNRRGFSAEKESHRPDLSARSIRRDGRLLAECRWHSATAVGARKPTTSKIFNGCSPQKRNPTAQILAPAPYGGMADLGRVHEVLA